MEREAYLPSPPYLIMGREVKRYLASSQLTEMRVLVVDDNTTSLEILKNALESFSFEVTTAKSGEEALLELSNNSEERPL